MPKIKEQDIKRVTLPSFDDPNDPAWAEVVTNVMFGNIYGVSDYEKTSEQTLQVLKACILDWNLQGQDGSKLAITEENIKKLSLVDIAAILKHIRFSGEPITTEKKSG